MRILAISDEPSGKLWGSQCREALTGVDLILSAGDLPPAYLSFLTCFTNAPVIYVHGNHDDIYEKKPPEGCLCADGKILMIKGIRILGLGGCPLYNGGPHQYTEKQMRKRFRKLWWKLRRAKGFDILLTHAPARGFGDMDDPVHRGFFFFVELMEKWQPRYLVHGHIHTSYKVRQSVDLHCGETTIINACGYRILEIPDPEEDKNRK